MRWLLAALLLAAPTFGQETSKYAPQQPEKVGPVTFHLIPQVAIGVALEDRQFISSSTTEPFIQVRVPGLVIPGMKSTATGVMVEFADGGFGQGARYRFFSVTRIPIAAGFFTGVDVKMVEGQDGLGAAFDFTGAPVVGFKFMELFDKINFDIELALFTPDEPLRALVVIGF